MVLEQSDEQQLVFLRREPARPLTLSGFAFCIMASLPWLMPGLTPTRLVTSLLLALAGVALLWRSRMRRERVRIDLARRNIKTGTQQRSLEQVRELRLSGSDPVKDLEPRHDYRAELMFDDGSRCMLLERDDPAGVLRDVELLLKRLPSLSVQSGWGLPSSALPWRDDSRSELSVVRAPRDAAAPMVVARVESQRRVGLTVVIAGMLTALAMGLMMFSRIERGEPIAPLSLVLSGVVVTLIVGIGLVVLTDRLRVSIGDRLEFSRSVLGVRRETLELERDSVRGAYAVAPDDGPPRHLLLLTRRGPLALRCAPEAARQLAERLSN